MDSNVFCYDVNGNVYMDINGKLYILEINRDNDIEFSFIDHELFYPLDDDIQIKYKKMDETETNPLLKPKVAENDEEYDNDDHQNDKKYCEEIDKDDNNDDFVICTMSMGDKGSLIRLDKILKTESVYDIVVIDNIGRVTLTIQNNNGNAYRIYIYPNKIELNIVGDQVKEYSIKRIREILKHSQYTRVAEEVEDIK
jgi:hypothetical protein